MHSDSISTNLVSTKVATQLEARDSCLFIISGNTFAMTRRMRSELGSYNTPSSLKQIRSQGEKTPSSQRSPLLAFAVRLRLSRSLLLRSESPLRVPFASAARLESAKFINEHHSTRIRSVDIHLAAFLSSSSQSSPSLSSSYPEPLPSRHWHLIHHIRSQHRSSPRIAFPPSLPQTRTRYPRHHQHRSSAIIQHP